MKRPRLGRRAKLGLAAGVIAFAATLALALTRNGGAGSASLPLASLATLGRLETGPDPGPLGPEGVPIPPALPLGARRVVSRGERIDGITCNAGEQLLFHIHAHLTIFVRGIPQQVPAGIGIAPPYEIAPTPQGPFIAGASCFMWLHTHAADGIIHTESPISRTYTLGNFFDIWGQPLGRDRVGPAHGHVTALFDGSVYTGDPRSIPLLAHAQIQLDVGRPLVSPERISFPNGL